MITTIFFTFVIFIIISVAFYFLIWRRVSDTSDIIKLLSRQAARWNVAAEQDTNMIIATLHANYSAGYLWAIKDITDDAQFRLATGLDLKDFETKIINTQDKITRKLVESCKTIAPTNTDLIKVIYGA